MTDDRRVDHSTRTRIQEMLDQVAEDRAVNEAAEIERAQRAKKVADLAETVDALAKRLRRNQILAWGCVLVGIVAGILIVRGQSGIDENARASAGDASRAAADVRKYTRDQQTQRRAQTLNACKLRNFQNAPLLFVASELGYDFPSREALAALRPEDCEQRVKDLAP